MSFVTESFNPTMTFWPVLIVDPVIISIDIDTELEEHVLPEIEAPCPICTEP
jgi:hypothetical protein